MARLTTTPSKPPTEILLPISYLYDFILCWLRSLSSRGRNASTRRHNNDSRDLEIKSGNEAAWAPRVFELIGKDDSYSVGQNDWS